MYATKIEIKYCISRNRGLILYHVSQTKQKQTTCCKLSLLSALLFSFVINTEALTYLTYNHTMLSASDDGALFL